MLIIRNLINQKRSKATSFFMISINKKRMKIVSSSWVTWDITLR